MSSDFSTPRENDYTDAYNETPRTKEISRLTGEYQWLEQHSNALGREHDALLAELDELKRRHNRLIDRSKKVDEVLFSELEGGLFVCPIMYTPMTDPVVLETGNIYDKESIERHFAHQRGLNQPRTDPLTNIQLNSRRWYEPRLLKETISTLNDLNERDPLDQYQRAVLPPPAEVSAAASASASASEKPISKATLARIARLSRGLSRRVQTALGMKKAGKRKTAKRKRC